jgi:acyl dehydratase
MATFSELVPVGEKFTSPGRTIGEGDFAELHNLTWTTNDIHTDQDYMRQTQFGERLLAGVCTLACMEGLQLAGPFLGVLYGEGRRPVAHLGFEEVRFTAPVKPGDTIRVQSEILGVRPTSKDPKRGVMRVGITVFNQRGEQVMRGTEVQLLELTG